MGLVLMIARFKSTRVLRLNLEDVFTNVIHLHFVAFFLLLLLSSETSDDLAL